MGQADHAALTGPALMQAKQLRYLKIGGRIFLVAGVGVGLVDPERGLPLDEASDHERAR